MTTENEKVSAYLPKHISEKFKAYKINNNLKTDSQAVISIIAQFLGIESSVKTTGVTLNEFQNLKVEVANLKEFYEKYSFIFDEPTGSLLGKLPAIVESFSSFIDEFNSLKNKLERSEYRSGHPQAQFVTEVFPTISVSADKLNVETSTKIKEKEIVNNSKVILKVKELAKRLQVHETRVYSHRKTEKFTEWTRGKDPEGIGWLVLESGEFIPEKEVSSIENMVVDTLQTPTNQQFITLKSERSDGFNDFTPANPISEGDLSPLSSLPVTLSSELPQIDKDLLARRLGLKNPRTISNISVEETQKLAQWSAARDPDGIAWGRNNSAKPVKYMPIVDPSDELLSTLQKWITDNQVTDSGFRAAATKSKTKGVNLNRLLDDAADSHQGELLKT